MSAGGEAHDADPVGIEFEFGGMGTDEADGSESIIKGNWVSVGCESIAEYEGGDAHAVEESSRLNAFVIHSVNAVAATGADDDGSAVRLVSCGEDPKSRLICGGTAGSAGGTVCPEKFEVRILCGGGGCAGEDCGDREAECQGDGQCGGRGGDCGGVLVHAGSSEEGVVAGQRFVWML